MERAQEWIRHLEDVKNIKHVHKVEDLATLPLAQLALVLFVGYFAITLAARCIQEYLPSQKQLLRPRSPDPEKPSGTRPKADARPPGGMSSYAIFEKHSPNSVTVWIPSDWKRPEAAAYPDWSVTDTKPLPYRPFRYGPNYNVTMGLRTMNWDEWIELDNQYLRYHADKNRRIKERGHKCCMIDPDPRVYDGALELAEELVSYLPQRYPSMFKKTDVGMDNIVTNEVFDIRKDHLTCNGQKENPMQLAARMVQDDLAIMFEREDGQYYLLAGAVLLAGFWRLEDKFGMVLSELHTSGDVPQYKEKLEKGMMNFFRRVKPEAAVLRNNYFLQVDDQLAWSTSIGDEDATDGEIGWFTAEKNKAIQHHFLRSERQSLRRYAAIRPCFPLNFLRANIASRLPRSGGVVFTIRTYFHPITELCQEPYVPGRLASAVRSWGDDVSKYKGKDRYADVLLEYLDAKHEEQVANGLDLSKEDEVRHYPY